MSTQDVRRAFVVAAKEQVEELNPDLKIAWPNKKFNPPNNEPWVGFHWVPVDKKAVTLGEGGEDELVGFIQLDINVPEDSGEELTELFLASMEAWFVAGRPVVYDSQAATVTSTSRSGGRTVDPYFRTSLTINFYARIIRPGLSPESDEDFSDEFNSALDDW
jgi:hypothetical protein